MARLRVASVGFVNARPLVEGLEADCDLTFDVPSGLLGRLRDRSADVALLPVIDLQREPDLRVLPGCGIGCDGPTLTVRLFAKRPLDAVDRLACDPDSHTSVALSRVIFDRHLGRRPELVDLGDRTGRDDEALLLIGDKVVTAEPAGYPHQLDLGLAWKRLTGRPFVFAAWAAREGVDVGDLGDLGDKLVAAKRRGLGRVDAIVRDHAVPRGWPAEVARRYFTEYLRYDVGDPELDAIRHFHRLASEVGALDHAPWDLRVA